MEEEDNFIVKSKYDNRDYRVITMENGLQALLVHDPNVATKGDHKKEVGQTKMSAAASMIVGVGALHARKYSQGLPHLLEHMIGEGSRKFSTDYETYISQHNGWTNAFTTSEYSCYSFEVSGIFLKKALRRFADGFIAPLLARKRLKAEVKAVNNEFNEKKRGLKFIHHDLLCHTSIEGHPYNGIFHCGNRRSLLGEEVNKANYDRLHKELLKFHNKYYIGKLMKLVVIGGESLDELQGWIKKLFKSIRMCPVKKKLPITPRPSKLLNSMWKGYFGTHIQSKKRKRSLSERPKRSFPKRPIWKSGQKYQIDLENQNPGILLVSWTLPPQRKVYGNKSDRYISHFLNKKGNGSLFSLLKEKGLAKHLIASIDTEICSTSMADIFIIEIGLTISGTSQIDKIIGLIYECLALLRDSPPEWIYKEIQSIGELEFNFRAENNQEDYAVKLSENLLLYPPEHVICAKHLCAEWSQPVIKEVLGYFVPRHMRIDVFSDHFEIEASECFLPWLQIRYSVHDIEKSSMELWEQTREAREPLQLSCKNEFIPNNTSILIGDISDATFSNMISPKYIVDEESMKLWYKRDCNFKGPFACVYIHLKYSKGVWDNAKLCVLSELFLALLYDKLDEVISKAQEAMFKIKLCIIDGMLEIKVLGLNEMLPSLLSKILSEVNSFMPTDASKYEYVKEDLEKYFMEGNDEVLDTLLREHIYENEKQWNHLKDLSLGDLRKFIEEICSQISIEGLVHGNLSEDDANNISKIIKQNFPKRSPPDVLRHVERVICLTPNTNFVVNHEGSSDIISTVQLYIQIGQNLFNSIKLMALLDLFEVIVEKPFSDRMRAEENLGYTVLSSSTEIHNVWGFCFQIQSSEYDPYALHCKIEEFIDGLEEDFKDLDNKKFKNYISCLVDKKLESCSSLEDESCRVWKEITKYSCQFNITQKVADELKQIKKEDLMKFYREYFKKSSPNCRQLKVNLWSSERWEKVDDFDTEEDVDIEENSNFY